jgi:predicted DNA-binding transcriptional regulator YafY
MATNKHATIRYHALDQCFSNPGRKYFIEDLITACNNALYEYAGIEEGIKRRQVFDDIKFMESEQGWSIPLDRIKDGKRVYYRYYEKSFSIKNQAINETEVKQLKETLSILTRFKGMPQFEWMEEMLIRIESAFYLKGNNTIVGFEQNPYLKGLNFFTELFNAIQYKKVIEIQYQGFNQSNPVGMTIHPYFLKQYNSRWFLFGFNGEFETISNLALDRIAEIKDSGKVFIENRSIDFEEYFEDVIGVTVNSNQDPVKVTLQISKNIWPYIQTKPIHGSQKIKLKGNTFTIITLDLIPNYELESIILSYGEGIEVLEPLSLRNRISERLNNIRSNYKTTSADQLHY